MDVKVRHLGLTSATVPFIAYLLKKEGVHQDEMAESLHFDKSSAARAISVLESKGYAVRVTDENNKRRNLVYPTEKGRDIEEELMLILRSLTRDLFGGFTDEEKQIYFDYTEKINKNLMKMLGND